MIEEMPIGPPPGVTAPGRWESYEVYAPDGSLESRTYTWVPDPIPTAPEKHRKTAREVQAQIKVETDLRDVTITTFKALATPTVAQHRRFSADCADHQVKIDRLQRRLNNLVLDALDGNVVETPLMFKV